jgi:glycerol-3-phosphate cytidylyltransferase-like family protein
VAIVARDSVVEDLKGALPENKESERIKMLTEIPEVDLVYLGDLELGTYKTLQEIQPDIIYLGYDQGELHESLSRSIQGGLLPEIELVFGKAHKPEELHNSILKKKKKISS